MANNIRFNLQPRPNNEAYIYDIVEGIDPHYTKLYIGIIIDANDHPEYSEVPRGMKLTVKWSDGHYAAPFQIGTKLIESFRVYASDEKTTLAFRLKYGI